ncbi:30S ribosome-binding factor RbfA [Flavobacteriaceae bacterium]|nr:30S ribosome-binding factor RbfA [Flavobacteriaceae bacterium]
METQRQKKISSLIQKEVANLISADLRRGSTKNLIISVTQARVSPDLSLCKIYLSIFPSEVSSENLSLIQGNAPRIKHDLSGVLKNHLRKVPELAFFLDDSLDYIESVEDSIQNPDNPIKG